MIHDPKSLGLWLAVWFKIVGVAQDMNEIWIHATKLKVLYWFCLCDAAKFRIPVVKRNDML
jgi:hypothetical protein